VQVEINYGIPIQQIGRMKQDFGTQYKIKNKNLTI
jgi:hypothetical protein